MLSERVFWTLFSSCTLFRSGDFFPVSIRWCYKWIVLTIWTYGPFIYLALLTMFGKCQSVLSLALFCSNQDKTLFIYLFLQFVSLAKWRSIASVFALRISSFIFCSNTCQPLFMDEHYYWCCCCCYRGYCVHKSFPSFIVSMWQAESVWKYCMAFIWYLNTCVFKLIYGKWYEKLCVILYFFSFLLLSLAKDGR